ncbi:class Ib ribonucleoside-diphosphate reductase assembly flavoprotein NrdI [Pilibacter termitis]|nr:class Ib ribonucleoside-diphosphate reductase assembly flavoprotein NrdI [Pilibacter termitis]
MKIVYFSLTGQTRRFVKKTGLDAFEITASNSFTDFDEPYVLIVPTYEKDVVTPVFDFLENGRNAEFCAGVAGGGNRNFAELFVFTAKDIAKDYHVPLLYTFEFNGTEEDVKYIQKVVKSLES